MQKVLFPGGEKFVTGGMTGWGQEFCPKASHTGCLHYRNTEPVTEGENLMCPEGSDGCNSGLYSFLAVIQETDFVGKLYAPFNLPLSDDDKFELEPTLLIDRIADWWVGDPLYEPEIFNDTNATMTPIMRSGGSEFVQEAEEAAVNETLGAQKMTKTKRLFATICEERQLGCQSSRYNMVDQSARTRSGIFGIAIFTIFFLIVEVTTIMCIYLSCSKIIQIVREKSLQILNRWTNSFGKWMDIQKEISWKILWQMHVI